MFSIVAYSCACQWQIQDFKLGGRNRQRVRKGAGVGGGVVPPAPARGHGGVL